MHSSDPVIIGKHIDGKPIYRRTFTGYAVQSNTVILLSSSYIETIINAYGSVNSTYNRKWNIPFYSPETAYHNIWALNTETGIHKGQLYLQFGPNYNNTMPFCFTIEYTLSTDS